MCQGPVYVASDAHLGSAPAEREEAFLSTLHGRILPDLDAAGLGASAIWKTHEDASRERAA